ncbi:hypothetical protein BDZ94DRAFT_1255649 [Collybia nuda]|uniref:Uncharacterized protein n=1 Tax=Collybia nuda TaxID=64659 RepID=A0A9P5Y7B4_9AGAR|nr:hypothetical protein BDZ94DRAFT_1255649 [Collybia nuda]
MNSLKYYLRECALPTVPTDGFPSEPPLIGHKSHKNYLAVRPETWRRLETICPLAGAIDNTVTSWVDANVPEMIKLPDAMDSGTLGNLTIPSPSMPNNFFRMLKSPENILRLASWLDNLPLQTVEKIVHLLYPNTQSWGFNEKPEEWFDQRDKDIFRCFTWSTSVTLHSNRPRALVVAYQPPWILTHQDIKEFSECRSFPPFRKLGNAFPIPLKSRERLWAKMWDTCVQHRTHWFVLTSYDNWVFGTFSTGFTTAFVTNVYSYDSYNPTIIEFLTFWTLSATGIVGCTIPKVPEPVAHHMVPTPMPKSSTDIPNAVNSESNWDSKSYDFASSAGVWSNLSSTPSTYTGLSGATVPIHRGHGLPSTIVAKWLADAGVNALRADAPEIAPSDSGPLLQIPYNRHVGDWLV